MVDTHSPLGNIQLAATSFYVADLDAAINWYQDKLGLTPMAVGKDGHRYASFLLGGAIMVLEPIQAALEPTGMGTENTTINLIVDEDPLAVRESLVQRDVPCGPPVVSPNFVSFLVRDLDGNRFYVTRPANQEAQESVRDLRTSAS
jgi:catechol 2,3-dioxygenase-like lactoylglutathione lyase family enzyme